MYLIASITTHIPTQPHIPCWLTGSGRLNHKVVTHPASSLVQDRESLPAVLVFITHCREYWISTCGMLVLAAGMLVNKMLKIKMQQIAGK